MITKRLIALLLLFCCVACSTTDSPIDNPAGEYKYLSEVLEEKHIDKETIAQQIMQYASSSGVLIPELLVNSLVRDVDVAAISYKTTAPDGSPIIASGVVAMPSGTNSYDNLLSIQHSTLDIDDAPSHQLFYYEMLPVVMGHVVVMADYLGYGVSQTPDRQHPYLHASLTGTACADMIEAAREYLRSKSVVENADVIELMGYSQGGQASIATQMIIEQRGGASRIKAVHAGGGAYDLITLLDSFTSDATEQGAYSRAGYLPYLIRGIAYGEQLSVSDENLYAPSLIEKELNKMFSTSNLSTWHAPLGDDIREVIHPDFYAPPTYNGNKDAIAMLNALAENSLINAFPSPQSSIQLYHSPQDESVFYVNAVRANLIWESSTLTDLAMPSHALGGLEFVLRYLKLWDLFAPQLKSMDSQPLFPLTDLTF